MSKKYINSLFIFGILMLLAGTKWDLYLTDFLYDPACRIACDDSLQSNLGTDTLPGYGRCVTIQSLVCFVQSYRVFFSERSYQFFCRLIALPAWLSVSDDPKASLPELHPGFCPGRDDDDIKNDHGSTFFKRHSSRPVNCRRMLVLFLSQTGE